MGSLRICDFVGMHYALRLRYPNRKRFDIGYTFVKCAIRLRIPHSLIERVKEVVKECVLVIHVEGQYAVKESRHVVEVVFAYFFAPVAVAYKQANIAQRLTGIRESWDIAAFDNAPEHETQSGSAVFRLKVVLSEIAAIVTSPVAFRQCPQPAKPPSDPRAKPCLTAK